MNKIRWRILWALCLLLSAIPIATTGQVWASAPQQAVNASVQAAVSLLLDDNDPVTDSGFRPNPQGYSFRNYGGINGADLTVNDLRPIFGDNAVCAAKFAGVCLYNPAAVQFRNDMIRAMNDGHCYGMAVTASRFFAGVDRPASLQANAATPFDLQLGNARRHIASYFVRQGANPAASARRSSLAQTPVQVLQQIRNSFDSPADSLTIDIWQGGSGHTVTPYSVVDKGSGLVWIMVYDNNHPNDANRHIDFNTVNNTWSYNLGGVIWSGNASTHSIDVIPYQMNNALMQCPWCRNTGNRSAGEISQVWAIGDAKMLVINAAGQRYGYVDDTFVQEIPDASTTVLATGLQTPSPTIYNIPISGTQTLLLNSGVITQPTAMTLSQFGPDYAVTIDGITLNPAKQDQVQIAADGKQVAYQASESKSISLTLALVNMPSIQAANANTDASESYAFTISGADVKAGQAVIAAVDSANGTLTLSNAQDNSGSYGLQVERTDSVGQRTFSAETIAINAGDTHVINYALWGNVANGAAPLTIQVDQGSNGTIDNTEQVENQAGKVYLPVISTR